MRPKREILMPSHLRWAQPFCHAVHGSILNICFNTSLLKCGDVAVGP